MDVLPLTGLKLSTIYKNSDGAKAGARAGAAEISAPAPAENWISASRLSAPAPQHCNLGWQKHVPHVVARANLCPKKPKPVPTEILKRVGGLTHGVRILKAWTPLSRGRGRRHLYLHVLLRMLRPQPQAEVIPISTSLLFLDLYGRNNNRLPVLAK